MHDEGSSYAEQHKGFSTRKSIYDARFLGLSLDRDALYRRIDDRVDAMLAAGLLVEVEGLMAAGYEDALTAAQAIGYKEFVPVVGAMLARHSGVPDARRLAEAVEAVKRSTRRFAKRQLTWFRADPRVTWLDVTYLSPDQVTDAAFELVESWATRR
jgi:tRNA dimethylallyltransferase